MKYLKTGIFKKHPLPWRYAQGTRNVLADDGSIVCRCGDNVYADPEVGETIVRVFNRFGVDRNFDVDFAREFQLFDSTVKSLRTQLDDCPDNAIVKSYNGDTEQMEEITSLLLLPSGAVEIGTHEV